MNLENKQHIVLDARMIRTSGIGRYIQAMVPMLFENFQKITLLGTKGDIANFEWASKVNIVSIKAAIYSIAEQCEILLKTPKCDIFISPHYNVPVILPQAKKIAVIIPDTNHLVFAYQLSFGKRQYAKLFFKLAVKKDIIFTISDFSKSEIVKFTGCDPRKIVVAKCAVDKNYFKMLDSQLESGSVSAEFEQYKNQNFILFTGNVKPHKNLKRALLAFEQVSATITQLRFLIVGKKDNFLTAENEIFRLIEENDNLKTRVEFTGQITDLNLAYLYKHAKAFLFPSLYEGFGLPPLEAMIFGCPVIASKEGSLPEICGDAAHYCDAYDINDIARASKQVLTDDNLRETLIAKGFKKVNEYSWSSFNQAILNGLISGS